MMIFRLQQFFSECTEMQTPHTMRFRSYSLKHDPFQNFGKIRDTHSRFPVPHFVSFDAFGTLYTPKTPVYEQYHRVASEHGVTLDMATIKSRFTKEFADLQARYPNYGRDSPDMALSDDWWRQLVSLVFELPKSSGVCDALLHHFTTGDAYRVFPDVEPTLRRLRDLGVPLVVASNSDDRVVTVLENLGLSHYFDDVHLSYHHGSTKPDRRFFGAIVDQRVVADRTQYLENVWHVGDSYDADFTGAVRAGWNGVLVDRAHHSRFFAAAMPPPQDACFLEGGKEDASTDKMIVMANNRVAVSDLREFPRLFRED